MFGLVVKSLSSILSGLSMERFFFCEYGSEEAIPNGFVLVTITIHVRATTSTWPMGWGSRARRYGCAHCSRWHGGAGCKTDCWWARWQTHGKCRHAVTHWSGPRQNSCRPRTGLCMMSMKKLESVLPLDTWKMGYSRSEKENGSCYALFVYIEFS
jgi:hypothetical protein